MSMRQVIEDLIDGAPDIDNAITKLLVAEAPLSKRRFLDCQIVLKGGYVAAEILTYANNERGVLEMVSVAKDATGKITLADQFFTHDEVQTIIVGRDLPTQLVTPVGNGGLVLGH